MAYKRSKFPQEYDVLPELYDLPPSMIAKANEYRQLQSKNNKSQSEIERFNALSIELQDYIISPEWINTLGDAITGTQKHYIEETSDYVKELQEETEAFVNEKINEANDYSDGLLEEYQVELDKFNHKGEYNPSTQYFKRNTVTYNGETYLCRKDVLGIAPDPLKDTEYWAKIAARGARGERGDSGIGLKFRGAWNPDREYQIDDAVQDEGFLFACTRGNTGERPNPDADTTYWKLALSRGSSTVASVLRKSVSVTNKTSNVPIGISEFNSRDFLLVIKNSNTISPDVNYKINENGTSIDSLEGQWDGSEHPITFHFIVLKNMVVDLIYTDGNMIEDGTIGKEKIKNNLIEEIDSKATQNELSQLEVDLNKLEEVVDGIKGYALRGSAVFNSTTGVSVPHSIGNIDYQVNVTPSSNPNGYLGEVWIEKSMNSFMVYCSGNDTSTKFDYIVFD